RRGTTHAGLGAVIVKVAARDHDYRFDVPAIGLETLRVAIAGGAAVLAVEAGRVVALDGDALVREADAANVTPRSQRARCWRHRRSVGRPARRRALPRAP